jgi:hypothetical protein
MLMDLGMEIPKLIKNGDSPLQRAVRLGLIDFGEAFLDAGFDANAKGGFSENLLHRAAKGGCIGTTQLLLSARPNVHGTNGAHFQTPIGCARTSELAAFLRSNGSLNFGYKDSKSEVIDDR